MSRRQWLIREIDGVRVGAEAVIERQGDAFTIVGLDSARPWQRTATNLLDAIVVANAYVDDVVARKARAAQRKARR
jgi:hypothetical protein